MKITIKDRQTLLAIPPSLVAVYLRSRGWERVAHEAGRYSMWARPADAPQEIQELLLPLDHRFADFTERMADLLDDLQRTEERSQLEILRDISASNCDVYRFRKHPQTGVQGTIPIEAGAQLVAHARDFLLYGATAEHDPTRQSVGGRRSDEVARFMDQALLGQTEVASFVVTAQVPVPNRLIADMFPESVAPSSEPFERRAGVRLMNVLGYTREAAMEAAQTFRVEPFAELLREGASVGLYSSVVEAQELASGAPLEVSCAWAPGRPLIGPTPISTVVFEPEIIPPLREAVNILRPRVPREGIRVVGVVELLQRPAQEELIGELAVTAEIEGKIRKVHFSLQRPEYDEAIEAFKERLPIAVVGDLVKEGRFWTLRAPRNLRVVRDEEEPQEG